jgi:DivIVA domain-containing protein
MIDLTPLDVRNKRGDFKKLMRGYDPQEVDVFLEIVAERLEALTRENMALKERTGALQAQVNSQTDREQAVQAALVTAQELRADIRAQAQREAENVVKSAETEGRRLVAEAEAEARTKLRDAERQFDKLEDAIQMLDHRRLRFLKEFRQLLQREMDVVAVEEAREPMEERAIDLDLGGRRSDEPRAVEPRFGEPKAAAPEREAPPAPSAMPATPAPPPPPAQPPRHDNFLLYLDADADDASR